MIMTVSPHVNKSNGFYLTHWLFIVLKITVVAVWMLSFITTDNNDVFVVIVADIVLGDNGPYMTSIDSQTCTHTQTNSYS